MKISDYIRMGIEIEHGRLIPTRYDKQSLVKRRKRHRGGWDLNSDTPKTGETSMKISEQLRSAKPIKAGEGDLEKTVPAARKWIKTLMDHAKKADRELSKGSPGRDTSYFVGFMKGYRDEGWYEHFYG